MKDQEFKTVQALGAVDHVCCYYSMTHQAWELWIYGDDEDPVRAREVNRLGNRMITARGESRVWKSLDSLVDYLVRAGVKISRIRLDGEMPSQGKQAKQVDWAG